MHSFFFFFWARLWGNPPWHEVVCSLFSWLRLPHVAALPPQWISPSIILPTNLGGTDGPFGDKWPSWVLHSGLCLYSYFGGRGTPVAAPNMAIQRACTVISDDNLCGALNEDFTKSCMGMPYAYLQGAECCACLAIILSKARLGSCSLELRCPGGWSPRTACHNYLQSSTRSFKLVCSLASLVFSLRLSQEASVQLQILGSYGNKQYIHCWRNSKHRCITSYVCLTHVPTADPYLAVKHNLHEVI